MASINWMKCTTQKAAALYVHMNTKARTERSHSNENIDKTKTKDNYCIGTKSYAETIARMKKRTEEVDKIKPPQRVRKDRVTCCMMEYTCPKELTDKGKQKKFFETMHEVLCQFFGAENVHGTFIHVDEIHTYTDYKTGTERQSLAHAHTLVSAYSDEYGINGKNFETRQRLKELNNITNYVIKRLYGMNYNNGDGRNYETIESLKAMSRTLKQNEKQQQEEQER